ncbi:hypothetical protein HZB02_03225 [Candidatus Woesearchaeota archaeon]|nr:hypothetical protein [Candidatus Woesearchaeota archaeon]
MKLFKKADLALSTNAIVVLIIAIAILGLALAFVTTSFGSISKKLTGFTESEPEPSTANAGNPLTVSRSTVIASKGEEMGLKFSVYCDGGANGATACSTVTVGTPTCAASGASQVAYVGSTTIASIPPLSSGTSTVLLTAKNTGTALCTFTSIVGTNTYQTDVLFKIQ